MYSFSVQTEALTTPEAAFEAVADLMKRGYYMADGVTMMREVAPRPPSETEKFLPGQRVAYMLNGAMQETQIAEVEEWDQAEANILETPVRPTKGEKFEWRISELMPGTLRITLTFSADFGAMEKISKGGTLKKFWGETLERLKVYVEDKRSFAGARTFAPKESGSGWDDPLANF